LLAIGGPSINAVESRSTKFKPKNHLCPRCKQGTRFWGRRGVGAEVPKQRPPKTWCSPGAGGPHHDNKSLGERGGRNAVKWGQTQEEREKTRPRNGGSGGSVRIERGENARGKAKASKSRRKNHQFFVLVGGGRAERNCRKNGGNHHAGEKLVHGGKSRGGGGRNGVKSVGLVRITRTPKSGNA